jgi:hypothetical protein
LIFKHHQNLSNATFKASGKDVEDGELNCPNHIIAGEEAVALKGS